MSGGPPGSRPVPSEGLRGGAKYQSQRWDDTVARCCPDGTQHCHCLAGEPKTAFIHKMALMDEYSTANVMFYAFKSIQFPIFCYRMFPGLTQVKLYQHNVDCHRK